MYIVANGPVILLTVVVPHCVHVPAFADACVSSAIAIKTGDSD